MEVITSLVFLDVFFCFPPWSWPEPMDNSRWRHSTNPIISNHLHHLPWNDDEPSLPYQLFLFGVAADRNEEMSQDYLFIGNDAFPSVASRWGILLGILGHWIQRLFHPSRINKVVSPQRKIHPWILTWHWKIPIFNHLQMVDFPLSC